MQSQQYQTKTKAMQQKMLEQIPQAPKPKSLQKKSSKRSSERARHLFGNQEKLINQRKDQQNKSMEKIGFQNSIKIKKIQEKRQRFHTENLVRRTQIKSEQVHGQIKKQPQFQSGQTEWNKLSKMVEQAYEQFNLTKKRLNEACDQRELRKKQFDQARERKEVNLEDYKYVWERAQKNRSDALKDKELSYQAYLNSKKDFEDYRKMMMKKKRY